MRAQPARGLVWSDGLMSRKPSAESLNDSLPETLGSEIEHPLTPAENLLQWGPFKEEQTSMGPVKYGPHEFNTPNEKNPKCDLPGSSVL